MKLPESLKNAPVLAALAGVFAIGLVAGRCGYGTHGGESTGGDETEHSHAGDTLYTCAMHPEVRLPEDGSCPICGMDLIPLDESKTQVNGDQISLTERARELARIRTTEVRTNRSQGGALRLVGKVDYDETRVRSITSWISGRIERLTVASTGEVVRRGQVIAVVYSPEVYAAQSDLIQARKQVARLQGADPSARKAAESARNAARERLKLLGVTSSDLQKMEAAESPWRQVSIRAQSAGTVLRKRIEPGAYVQPGTELFQVADLSKVWVQLDAYESDLPRLGKGQKVELSSRSIPGETFTGTIEFIDPVVSPQTRTARVRVEVDNKGGKLRPGMFADASIETGTGGDLLTVPASAVLFTGRRSVVYVEVPGTDRPTYELREIEVGPRLGEHFPVLSGLKNGERVVTQGAFALDADLQLRGGKSMMSSAGEVERIDWAEVPEPLRQRLETWVGAYLDVADALADDDLGKARTALERISKSGPVAGVDGRARDAWSKLERRWLAESAAAAAAGDIKAARSEFQKLSATANATVEHFGNPLTEPIRIASCPMVFDGTGGTWLQRQPQVNNAYAGAEMLSCGTIEGEVPARQPSAPTGKPPTHDHGGPR